MNFKNVDHYRVCCCAMLISFLMCLLAPTHLYELLPVVNKVVMPWLAIWFTLMIISVVIYRPEDPRGVKVLGWTGPGIVFAWALTPFWRRLWK